jgi:hypothetical protein
VDEVATFTPKEQQDLEASIWPVKRMLVKVRRYESI